PGRVRLSTPQKAWKTHPFGEWARRARLEAARDLAEHPHDLAADRAHRDDGDDGDERNDDRVLHERLPLLLREALVGEPSERSSEDACGEHAVLSLASSLDRVDLAIRLPWMYLSRPRGLHPQRD